MLTTQLLDPCLGNIECNYQQATIVILVDTNRCKSETICSRHELKQVVSGSTRKASHFDSIFTNFGPMYVSPEHFPPVGSSDHQTIMLNAGKCWPSNPIQHIFCRKHTPETNRQLGLLKNTTDCSHIHYATAPELKVSAFTSTGSILDKTVPLKKVYNTNNDKPWMTMQIKDLIKERQHAF